MGRPAAASDYCHLVFHLLSRVELAGPARLRDPAYDGWARGVEPAALSRRVDRCGAALARAIEAEGAALRVHLAAGLFDDLDAFGRVRRGDAALPPRYAAMEARLRARIPRTLDLLLDGVAELSTEYSPLFERAVGPSLAEACAAVAPWLERAGALLPELSARRVELVWSLGARGRGLADRICVGAPAAWNALVPQAPCVLALHEACVDLARTGCRSAEPDYWLDEWDALSHLAALMRHAPLELEATHCAWLASLDLDPLLVWARGRDLIRDEDVARLRSEPLRRAEVLAALAG